MCLTESGVWESVTSACMPGDVPLASCREGGTITVPSLTSESETDTIAMAVEDPVTFTRSPSPTERMRQSSSCMSTVGSDVSKS